MITTHTCFESARNDPESCEACRKNAYAPGWLDDELKRAQYRTLNRTTSAEQAWQEGYQAGLWYGKGGEATDNPYQFKESL